MRKKNVWRDHDQRAVNLESGVWNELAGFYGMSALSKRDRET